MSVADLVRAVESMGGVLTLKGDRIHCQLTEKAAPLVEEIRRYKPAVLFLLRERGRRQAFAHLRPLIGKRMWTPQGPGRLVVVDDYATVEFDDGSRLRWDDSTAVLPYA